jgi:hypothetical protein
MRSHARLLPVALLGLLTGCVYSDKPLSEPAPSAADKLLYGRWQADQCDCHDLVEFASPTEATPKTALPNQRLMVMSRYKWIKDGLTSSWVDRRAFVTTASGKTFLNVYAEKSTGAVPFPQFDDVPDIAGAYEFYRYQLDGDTLDLWTMDDDATLRAARNGLLRFRGKEWPKNGPDPSLVWIEGGRPLLDFLTGKEGGSVFPDSGKVRYTQVKDKAK